MGSQAFGTGLFELTRHARSRAQNRGIRTEVIELVLAHGDIELHAGEGLHSLQISRKGMERLAEAGVRPALREKALGVVLLVDPTTQQIITAMHAIGSQGRRYSSQFSTRSRGGRSGAQAANASMAFAQSNQRLAG